MIGAETMNLSLSKKADYVVKAAISLARAYDGNRYLKIREVAAEMAIPRSYTPQILDALIQKGLVESRAGKTGGYRLMESPDGITVLQVVEAGEGTLKPERCALSDGPCRWEDVCPMHEVISSAVDKFRETMASLLLSDLAQRDSLLELGDLKIPDDHHLRGDPFREFAVRTQAVIFMDQSQVVSSLKSEDGDWLSVLMLGSMETAIYEESMSYLFPEVGVSDRRLNVNLGYFHSRDGTISVPVTIESSKSSYEIPQLIADLLITLVSPGETHCELVGRFIFNATIFADREISGADSLAAFHEKLSGFSNRIVEHFLADFAKMVESRAKGTVLDSRQTEEAKNGRL